MAAQDSTIIETLEALRVRFDGCLVVAFADLSTGMILAASTASKTSQETLDTMCRIGVDRLLGSTAQEVGAVFADGDHHKILQAIEVKEHETLCFVRSPDVPEEAICISCAPDAAVAKLMGDATRVLVRFGAGG